MALCRPILSEVPLTPPGMNSGADSISEIWRPLRMVANNAFQQDFAVKKDFMPIDPYDNQTGEIESEEKGLCFL